MREYNHTDNIEFILLGFQNISHYKFLVFFLFFIFFVLTLYGNIFIIILVSTCEKLHSPMYFFLNQLSITDILTTLTIVPNTLRGVIEEGSTITLEGCIVQLFTFPIAEIVQCFILTIMSYDRYLAICSPLQYMSIMNTRLLHKLALWSWGTGFLITLRLVIRIYMLPFCGSNIIDHFFCDLDPLLELSCSNSNSVIFEDYTIGGVIALFSFTLISVTYIKILQSIFRNRKISGHKKAFSTCTSHLLVLSMFYGSLIAVYVIPSKGSQKKFLSLIYTMLTPLSNPIIYCLRNKEIRNAFMQMIKVGYCCQHTTLLKCQKMGYRSDRWR